jgi:hypothetical protein
MQISQMINQQRDCSKMTLFRALHYVCIIVGFFQIITVLFFARSTSNLIIFIVVYLLTLAWQVYLVSCIDSLHDKISDEKEPTRYSSASTQVNDCKTSYQVPE